MAYSYGEPRYGIGFSLRGAGEESGGSKTINYVNLAVGGTSAGYTPTQVQGFVGLLAGVTGKTATGVKMTAERMVVEDEEPSP